MVIGSWLSLVQLRKVQHTPAHWRAHWTGTVATLSPPLTPSNPHPHSSLFPPSGSVFPYHPLPCSDLQRAVMGNNDKPWTHLPLLKEDIQS